MIKGTEMLYLYEVEIFKDGDFYIAVPFDFGGATEGFSKMECLEMTSDLLTTEIQDQLMHGKELTEPTIDNEPQYGGKVYSFVIDTSLSSIPRMLKAEAARELGISQGRVSQLIRAGKLETFLYQGKEYVTKASVDARKEYNDFGLMNEPSEKEQDLVQSKSYSLHEKPSEQLEYSNVLQFEPKKKHAQTQTYEARDETRELM